MQRSSSSAKLLNYTSELGGVTPQFNTSRSAVKVQHIDLTLKLFLFVKANLAFSAIPFSLSGNELCITITISMLTAFSAETFTVE